MQLIAIISTLLAVASAAPVASPAPAPALALALRQSISEDCNVQACVVGLAGETAACATAAAQAGLDVFNDIACFAAFSVTVASGACAFCW